MTTVDERQDEAQVWGVWRQRAVAFQAEQAVLGAMISVGNYATDASLGQSKARVAELLAAARPDQYLNERHRAIADAVQQLVGSGRVPDSIAVLGELERAGVVARHLTIGHYLAELVGRGVASGSALLHCEQIVAEWKRKKSFDFAYGSMTTACNAEVWSEIDLDPTAGIAQAAMELGAEATDGRRDRVQTLAEDVDDVWEELLNPQPPFIRTGIPSLDAKMRLETGDVTCLGARPSVGKTLVLSSIARNIAIGQNRPVLFAALEMSRKQLVRRSMSDLASVRHDRLLHAGRLTPDDIERLKEARAVIEGAPLFHDYASEVTLATLEQQLAYLTGRVGPLGAVFVDHIGLMKATQKYERRQLELGDLSWGLKRLAKDYDTHVFMASQLNRGSLHRADPEPDLGDLRESGNLEQDCSNVILLNKPKQQEREGELDLVIGKNRDGEKDITVTVVLQGQFQRVTDLSRFAA